MPTPPNKVFATVVRGTVAWIEAIGAHPIPTTCVVVAAILLTMMNVGIPDAWDHAVQVLLVTAVSGFFGTLALELDLRRSFPIRRLRSLFALVLLGVLVGIFWPAPTTGETFIYQALIWGGSLAILLVAVAFRLPFEMSRPDSDLLAWYSGQRFVMGCVLALALASLLAGGVISALYAVEELLSVNVPGEVYTQMWILALAVIWPMGVMVEAERALPVNTKLRAPVPEQPPRWLGLVVGWALIPLSVVFTIILYLYLARLAILGEMPSGMIAPISAGYLTFGAVTHLAAQPLAHAGRPLARLYRRVFPFTMLLPLAALAWALWVRIDAYGVTEPRFLLALVAGWLLLLSLVWMPGQLVSPSRLAGLLGALLMVVGGGPWGAASVSLNSQRAQFLELLRAHDMVIEEEIPEEEVTEPGVTMRRTALPASEEAPPSAEDQARMIDILYFFDSRAYSGYLSDLFPNEPEDARAQDRITALALDRTLASTGRREVSLGVEPARAGLSTAGFDTMLPVTLWPPGQHTVDIGDGRTVRVTGLTLALVEAGGEGDVAERTLVTLDLAPMVSAIVDGEDNTAFAEGVVTVAAERMEVTAEDGGWRLRLLVNNMTVVERDDLRSLTHLDGVLLLAQPE
ncbi:DUF4153 domain-containing protein [Roseospira visakhapatnamensis]|uniref:DUF4153 domain-containing protein n=1 Tax=Roseospira visakhapatnamensis TaxID=390880 RepID=A0A7W6W849_9PROT|nr:DUF4153 domain-containing protein [Roseospira visakhapatnamensis]MBB4264620.1 hypothetical protein [Roseospira visakhapatnamensis]